MTVSMLKCSPLSAVFSRTSKTQSLSSQDRYIEWLRSTYIRDAPSIVDPHLPAPPYDPQLAAILADEPRYTDVSAEDIPTTRDNTAADLAAHLASRPRIQLEESTISGPGGPIELAILRPTSRSPSQPSRTLHPVILFLHAGGFVNGTRFTNLQLTFDWVEDHSATIISPSYRLAPGNPHPAPIDDVHATLLWLSSNASALHLDPTRLIVCGHSSGGGTLAAALCLMARDHDEDCPAIYAQMLLAPGLDDRNTTISAQQFADDDDEGPCCGGAGRNMVGWRALLGDRCSGTDEEVDCYASPARSRDLGELPMAYLDVGSAEAVRDEVVAYAGGIWAAGGRAELHVWEGVSAGVEVWGKGSDVLDTIGKMRSEWLGRILRRE